MDSEYALLHISDRIRYVKSFLNILAIAAGNTEYFPPEGQDIAVAIGLVTSELDGCHRILESAMDKPGYSGGDPHP